MSKPNKEVKYRTLFIGLGGTGGRVLLNLNNLLDDKQKETAHMIYIDLDKGDAAEIEALGMNTVVIGSSDTVRDVIARLGPNDGVNNWIPTAVNDKEFLSSKTDDGASQYRMKSRLCLANFLQNRNNKLAKLLTKLCKVGTDVSDETLRVMIVSSVAGGTGAGTFIQVALYVREFFRKNNHKDINIMGLFACPDLFARTLGNRPGDRTNLENMYANAYAAVRELNAMNLAVSTGGLDKIAPGYGKSINIKMHTRSEGRLFDPKDEKFLDNANNKPFNLLYFVDSANEEGGVLTSIEQYYMVMADIVYTRLYSPIEASIRSGESNELGPHSKYPTAIYGSAGYGRIIYPYADIVRYLAVRKTSEEVGGAWFAFEDSWQTFCKDQQAIAAASGAIWKPNGEDRARQYISEMDKGMKRKNSRLITLKGMMIDAETEQDRATLFLEALDAALNSGATDKAGDGIYSRCTEEEPKAARTAAMSTFNQMQENCNTKPLSALAKDVGGCLTSIEIYGNAMVKNLAGAALSAAGIVVPRSENAAKTAEGEKDQFNLFYGLLTAGDRPVHPLAARYLLYKLRDGMRAKITAYGNADMDSTIRNQRKAVDITMDDDSTDGFDLTMAEYYKRELKKPLVWDREGKAKKAAEKFMDNYGAALKGVANTANMLYKAAVYEKVLEYVEELIVQYEGLFDNLEQYKLDLDQKFRQESVRNNSSFDDRCIFVNASREAKAFIYERDSLTRNALREGDQEIAAAAGKGIYEALMERAWKKVDAKKEQMILQYTEEEVDTYSDMQGIFDDIVAIYTRYLKEKAPHLQVSVVDALVNQCCQEEGVERAELGDAVKKRLVRGRFEEVIEDMIARSYPMLAYDPHNADTYYQSEDGNTETKSYMHIGMNSKVVNDLLLLYGENDTKSAEEAFEEAFAPSKGLTVDDSYDKYTISCFSAVHCLQPTQILKFREDFDDGYYYYYKKRLAMISTTGCLSFTPHLDKYWHLREAMPYISRSMELEWHKKTTKAFVYELLSKNFTFTTTGDGVRCFNYKYDDSKAPIFVHWPEDRLVTVKDISRLIEYLEEQDERVEQLNACFDKKIDDTLALLGNYTDTMPLYKAAMTNCDTLKQLREDLCQSFTYTSSVSAKRGTKQTEAKPAKSVKKEKIKALQEASRLIGCDESVEALVDIKNTLGGLLQMAYLVHKSEEDQGRDKDYGEAIIKCALEIVEKLCCTMCGSNVEKDTSANAEYKDLYNSIIEKFMEAYVKYQLVQRNMFTKAKLEPIVGKDGDGEYTLYNRYLKIPNLVSNTKEFGWISAQWRLK